MNKHWLRNLLMAQMLLHNTDPNAGGGGGQDPAAAFQRLLDQHKNDGVAVASKLFDENFQHRTTIRELKAKAPKDGDVVLTGDDVKEWNAFKALNVTATDAEKAIKAVPELEKQNKELSGMESFREIAELGLEGSKLKLPVLKDLLAKHPDAQITFKSEKDADGNEAKVAYIQKTDKDSAISFAEFAKAEFADYLPSLKVTSEAYTPVPQGNTPDPKPQGGATSVFDRIRENVKKQGEEKSKPSALDASFGRTATV